MMLDILSTNRENVLEALGRFRSAIDALDDYLRSERFDLLEECLASGALNYRRLVEEPLPQPVSPAQP
jgi:hypothetical protein